MLGFWLFLIGVLGGPLAGDLAGVGGAFFVRLGGGLLGGLSKLVFLLALGLVGGGAAVLAIGGGAIADAGFTVAFPDERRRWSSLCFSPTLSSMLK